MSVFSEGPLEGQTTVEARTRNAYPQGAWTPDSDNENSAFPVLEHLQLLWFRRNVIVAITLFVFIVGYIQVSEIKNIYTATSVLMVALPQVQVVDIESVFSSNAAEDVEGEIEILRSRGLAAKIVERLDLTSYPEFNPSLRVPEESLFDFLSVIDPRTWVPQSWKDSVKEAIGWETERYALSEPLSEEAKDEEKKTALVSTAVNILLGSLGLQQLGRSYVINVQFSSTSPELAARLANQIPEAYILDQLESSFEATEKANAWLTEQLADLEIKVVESERAVVLYRDEYGLVAANGLSVVDEQVSELNSQLIIARAEKAEIDARLAQLRRLLRGGGQGVETASEVLSSALVQQLRSLEAQALSKASELAVEFGPKHPRMLQVQAEIIEIRERIRSEVERIAKGLEQEAEFASTRVASLESSLRAGQSETSAQDKESIQLRSLEREAAANRALYETFLTRFKETSSTQGMQTSDARIISKAEIPGSPSYPDRRKLQMNYLLAGFLGACTLVILLQAMNPGLMTPEQVQNVVREPVIGLIPMVSDKLPMPDLVVEKPNSALVEAINSLKFSLELSNPDAPVQAVQVTSSVPEEGKTTLIISLARVVAMSGKKVLLIDGDLRRPSVGVKLNLTEKHKGISDLVLAGMDAEIGEFIMRDEKGRLDFMPKGTARFANATDIFSSHRMKIIINMLKTQYDLILVDTPPVMAVADSRIIGRVMDKTLFVVRWEKTPRKVARVAVEQLRRAGVDIAGVVLQQVDLKRYAVGGHSGSGHYYVQNRYGKYYYG